jgi:hypothetical protein
MKQNINGSEPGAEYDDYDNENGNDNDNDSNDDMARLNKNAMALQRVKSLAERNRTVSHFIILLLLVHSYHHGVLFTRPIIKGSK